MTEQFKWLRPNNGFVVFHPGTRRRLAQRGERVRIDSYWTHLLLDPEQPVVETTEAEALALTDESTAAPSASTPTKSAKAAKEPA